MQKNDNTRVQRAVDIHLDSVNIHNDLGMELASLQHYVQTLALTEQEKETLKNKIESCRSSLYEYLDYFIEYSYENMNIITDEETKWK